jgi:hypothetical protein
VVRARIAGVRGDGWGEGEEPGRAWGHGLGRSVGLDASCAEGEGLVGATLCASANSSLNVSRMGAHRSLTYILTS